MEKIIWSNAFNIGVPEIDLQHQQIVKMLNRMLTASDTTTDSETVSDILTDMTRYANEHFRTEETFLESCGYPSLDAHKQMHFDYRKTTVDLCKETMDGVRTVPEKLLVYLRNWWTDHILKEDMKYKTFAESTNG